MEQRFHLIGVSVSVPPHLFIDGVLIRPVSTFLSMAVPMPVTMVVRVALGRHAKLQQDECV